jgi:6-phospho-3-hexuloisomerase
MEFQKRVDQIMAEIQNVLQRVDTVAAAAVVDRLLRARRVYVAGGGRSGLMARAFAQRLMHLGLTTYVAGETTTPAIRPEDVLIVCSGSGETHIPVLVSQVAKRIGAHVVAVTANRDSPLALQADTLLILETPHKRAPGRGAPTVQYAGSLFEQSVLILFDAIALEIGLSLGRSEEELRQRHANLE